MIELGLSGTKRCHLLAQLALQGVQSRNFVAHLTLVTLQLAELALQCSPAFCSRASPERSE